MFENSMNKITSYPKLSKKSCLDAYLRSLTNNKGERMLRFFEEASSFVWRDGDAYWSDANFIRMLKALLQKVFPQLCRYHHSSRVFSNIFRNSWWLSSLVLSLVSSPPSLLRFSMASSPWSPHYMTAITRLSRGLRVNIRRLTAVAAESPYGVTVTRPGRELGFTRGDVTPGGRASLHRDIGGQGVMKGQTRLG